MAIKKEEKTLEPIKSDVSPVSWFEEVASDMEKVFDVPFIIRKAKEAFGDAFDETRFKDIEGSLKERIMNVWESQK